MLTDTVITNKVFSTIKSMPNNKSPGPNVFTVEFFKVTWPIICTQVTTAAVKNFFSFW